MIYLGIETTCDETACGIVDENQNVLANVLYSQIPEHSPYGGVVPEIAARAHLEKIPIILKESLKQAELTMEDIDVIAYTRGPGLMGPLLVGASFAKGLAYQFNKPIAGVNHLEGHIIAAEMSAPDLKPPYISLTVSGGHTELSLCLPNFEFQLLGRTRDDAAGEAFDKSGKILGLPYPAGPLMSQLAKTGNRKFHRFPRAFSGEVHGDFSYSGLKTSVLRYAQEKGPEFISENINDICASVETAIVDALVKKCLWALSEQKLNILVIAGGVSANSYLRQQLEKMGKRNNFETYFPSLDLCTDNAAMIAGVASARDQLGLLDFQNQKVNPSLNLYN